MSPGTAQSSKSVKGIKTKAACHEYPARRGENQFAVIFPDLGICLQLERRETERNIQTLFSGKKE